LATRTLVTNGLVLLVVFAGLLIVITLAGGKKLKDLLDMVKEAGKLELTERAGWVSLFTVVLIAGVATVVVAVHEAKELLRALFKMGGDSGEAALIIGMAAVILALFLNLVFIFAMRGKPH